MKPAINLECLGHPNELPSDTVRRLAQARHRVELLIIDLAFDLDIPTTRQLNDQELV